MSLKNETNQEAKKIKNERMRLANENYRENMRRKGMFYFCMWIPKGILGKVKKYIEDLKND